MASPCEVHVEHPSGELATGLVKLANREALRIEQALSRYRKDNIVWAINNSRGCPVRVDAEMARMLDFAQTCFDMSDGLFDITSGVLRQLWNFDGSDYIPEPTDVQALLPRIGWEKVSWKNPDLVLPDGMQIDLGGIGKEYAVDRCVALVSAAAPDIPCLINFGGDLHATRAPISQRGWRVGIEAATRSAATIVASSVGTAHGNSTMTTQLLELQKGALTTSGDAQRFVLKDGIRYGHVLNPRTGWPIQNAPASVTVAGDSCLQAGVLSTLAILHGADAERFLQVQEVTYWCQW